MTIPSVVNRWRYSGNGTTTAFDYTSKIHADSELQVYVDGALKTLTTDYTVSNANVAGGGKVTFTTAPANGTVVLIVRVPTLDQPTGFKNQGAFNPERHETAYDHQAMSALWLQDQITRSVKAPIEDDLTGMDMALPVSSDRASKLLSFDENGNVSVTTPSSGAEANALNIDYDPAGPGAATRTVQAKLRDAVSVKDFGAVGDGTTNDTDELNNFFSYLASNGGIGVIPPGTYLTTTGISITPTSPFRIIGAGKSKSVIKLNASSDTTVFSMVSPDDVVISDIGLNGNFATTGFASHGFSISDPNGVVIERCHVSDYKNSAGLMFANTADTYGTSHFIDCTADGNAGANNGFLLADLLDSSIRNCDVENLAAAASPGYGLQLKNKCVRSKIEGGSARGCLGGYVLARDGAVGPTNCHVIGGNAYDSYEGLVVGGSTNCSVMGLDIDMNNDATASYAVNIGANSHGNVVDVSIRNVEATKTAIRVASDDQTVILRHGDGVGVDLLELVLGVDRCRMFIFDLVDTYTNLLDLVVDNSGTTTNEVVLAGNLCAGGLSGNSFLKAPTPSKPQNWIAFVGASDGVNIRTNGTDRVNIRPTYVAPGTDNALTSGRSGARWSEVFAATGTINTSDEREKTEIGAVPAEWLDAWADVEYSRFKFKDAVATKGDGARWHVGVVAQQVRDAFAARGLDALEIGLLCYDEWDDEYDTEGNLVLEAGNRWGIRADECQFLEAALLRREIARLSNGGSNQ